MNLAIILMFFFASVCSVVNSQSEDSIQVFVTHICQIQNQTANALRDVEKLDLDSFKVMSSLVVSFFQQYVGPIYSESYNAAQARYN